MKKVWMRNSNQKESERGKERDGKDIPGQM